MTPEERKQIERRAYIRRYLQLNGWKEFGDGWIKEPFMRRCSLEEAFKLECQQEA
jgi:hypothetical protein